LHAIETGDQARNFIATSHSNGFNYHQVLLEESEIKAMKKKLIG